jgi:hypothetical protein
MEMEMMPGMKDLIITSGEKREGSILSVEDKPSYPPGLRIHLDEDTVKKLGLSMAPDVGKRVHVVAVGEVVSVSKEEGRGDDHSFSFSIQLQEVDLQPAGDDKKVSQAFYGG